MLVSLVSVLSLLGCTADVTQDRETEDDSGAEMPSPISDTDDSEADATGSRRRPGRRAALE
jgi:hypothetical protein